MAHPKTLLVYPNPFTSPLDERGYPTGAFPWDPQHNPDRGWVGAHLAREIETDPKTGEEREVGEVFFAFDDIEAPIALPFILTSNHYREGVVRGDLIAADEETAVRCGIAKGDFKDPKAVIAAYRERAVAAWKAEQGVEAVPAIDRPKPPPTAPEPPATTTAAPTKASSKKE